MRRWVVLAGACLIATGCARKSASSPQAPDFSLKDLSGATVSLKDFRGHPVLLDFWATWCGPCRISIPAVEKFYKAHKADGVVVLGLNMDDEPAPVFAFVKRYGIVYPVLYAASSTVAQDYQMEGLPMFVLIAPDGKIVDRYDGFAPEIPEMWEKQLPTLLAQKK